MLRNPNVLLFVCDPEERTFLQELLRPHAELTWVCDFQQLTERLRQARYDALFCKTPLCTGSWREVIQQVRLQFPNLPVIILSRTAGEREWLDVLEAGAFDLLAPPYLQRSLLSVLEHAVASHEACVWHGSEECCKAKAS